MPSNFEIANTNPHKEVKKIISALYIEGTLAGFRVETAKGVVGDIELAQVYIELPQIMKQLNQWNLTLHKGLWKTDREIITGEAVPDLSKNKVLVRSLQYIIYSLERKYRQDNASDVWEVCFQYRSFGSRTINWLSGYLQASNSEEAAGYGRSYIAQMKGITFFEVSCAYCEQYYGEVDWGYQSPLLAIKLTLEEEYNDLIVPKAQINLSIAEQERKARDRY